MLSLEGLLSEPKYRCLVQTSREVHFYLETDDKLHEHFSRVRPYLDLMEAKQGETLERFIKMMADRASSAPALSAEWTIACQRYLELVCLCQGRTYQRSPSLLVGVDGHGHIAFAPVDDVRDLKSTFAAIRQQELARQRALTRAQVLRRVREHQLSRTSARSRSGPRQGLSR